MNHTNACMQTHTQDSNTNTNVTLYDEDQFHYHWMSSMCLMKLYNELIPPCLQRTMKQYFCCSFFWSNSKLVCLFLQPKDKTWNAEHYNECLVDITGYIFFFSCVFLIPQSNQHNLYQQRCWLWPIARITDLFGMM